MTFEKGLKRLESIVAKLERGDGGLDSSLKAFEEGVKLARELSSMLDEAEKKVELLVRGEDGGLRTVPFEEDGDQDLSGEAAEEG